MYTSTRAPVRAPGRSSAPRGRGRARDRSRGLWHRLWLGGALVALLATAACDESAPAAKPEARAPAPARVSVETARAGSLTDGWSYLGRVESALSAELAAAAAGHVLNVQVREGDAVKKGQVLLALDSAEVRAALAAARARMVGLEGELELAKRQYERLSGVGFPTISEPERERYERDVTTLEASLATQRAEVQRAQVQLAQHTLRAPFSGVVSSRLVDPGAWVSVGQPVLGLVALEDLEILAQVSDRLAGRIEVGGRAQVRSGDSQAEAEIRGIVGALDPETRTMRVRLVPVERPAWLLAGMAVDVEFPVELGAEAADGAVIVSRDAVLQGPINSRVVVVRDGEGAHVNVDVLARSGGDVLVRGDGLAAGDRVVVRGNERLRPGQTLEIVPALGERAGGGGTAPEPGDDAEATDEAARTPLEGAGDNRAKGAGEGAGATATPAAKGS
ncbi:efflux transporter, RND family, MFP subunit [Haliangium ochraceum DSM 14365]|uniref:Efflux transporter, RND family, MFP subunit n=1 Tax=Haliangium ochraceum (strain DSM 14365 / JCM 11303 / SMP-2) TaxID=502025 RepID=D0LNZ4_HALO1|nr:efflux transporter, RND family, MFP subunit [Haliangium ochraceum DSM 14365]